MAYSGPWPLTHASIDNVVPKGSPGTYLIGRVDANGKFIYAKVGRDDVCVNTRLHDYVNDAEYANWRYFKFQLFDAPRQAFEEESRVFHRDPGPKNKIHPARPDGDNAADLRRRIDSGALRAGQRVPSTRRLAKSWKVAVATASKALELLARDGVTVAVPRVGYVVGRPTPRAGAKSGRDGALTRARLVQAAIEAADQEGLEAVSMRGVAAKIGAPVTSLYRHIANKDELLRLMVDAAMAEQAHPAPEAGWRARLEIGARLEWALVKRHPWVARVVTLTRPLPSEASLVHADWMLGALEEAGFDATTRMNVHIAIYAFVQGLATNIESEARAEGETGVDDDAWMSERSPEFTAVVAKGNVPAFARVLSSLAKGFDLDLDAVFELGLSLLLDALPRRAGRAPEMAAPHFSPRGGRPAAWPGR